MNRIVAALVELAAAVKSAVAGEPANPAEELFYLDPEDRARLARTTLRMRAEIRGGVSVRDCTRAARLWVVTPEETPVMAEHLQRLIQR